MINMNLMGQFENMKEITCPSSYLGRFKERGLKTFLAENYSPPETDNEIS